MVILPLCCLAFIIVNLISESMLAITDLGFGELFSSEFSGVYTSGAYQYGLLPAIWGTVMAVAFALIIAFPVSLAMAVVASEFPLGKIGQGIRGALGVLSGIPPIVFAIMEVPLVDFFMRVKFGGVGLATNEMPTHALPFEGSTFLGGILLALLVIPFIAPLIHDSIENVPRELREASFGLGGNRWYTLRRVILPWAMPGIAVALGMGVLKAMGDVIIVAMVISWESGLPDPLWDILARTAPLTATGAGLAGGFEFREAIGFDRSVAYFIGLLLLSLAVVILTTLTAISKRFARRMQA
jgi:ABC-type phosphate transport system permease subunit